MRNVRVRLILVSLVTSLAALMHAPAAMAACAANTANLGKVTGTFSISTAGTYRVWSRISVPDTTNNSFTLEVDDTQCNITVGDNVPSLNTWTWVDYQGGVTTNKINMNLTAGTHTYTMYGRESNVKVDRIIFSPTTTCVPTGVGDNCFTVPDTQAPTVPSNLASPSKTTSSITLTWAASTDDTAVTSYKIYRGGTLLKTVGAPTVTTVDTGLTAATNYSYQVSAVDAANNESAKSAILSVNTDAIVPPPDTAAPTVPTGLSVTGKSATNVSLAWNASTDNTAVTGYKLFRNNALLSTLSAASRAFNDTSVVGSTTYTYQVSAYDAANNESARTTALSVTTNTPATPKVGDFTGDNAVDFHDLLALLSQYGKSNITYDLSGDGKVDFHDLLSLLSKYGK